MISQVESFFLVANNQAPWYLRDVISPSIPLWRMNQLENLNENRFKKMFTRTMKSFFPSCIVEWNGLDEILKKRHQQEILPKFSCKT